MKTKTAKTTAEKVMAYAAKQPEGAPLSATELLHLGSRAAVDQALSRLAKRGRLFRIGCGVYVRPVKKPYGEFPPMIEAVTRSIRRKTGETLAIHPAVSVNMLGLSNQVPLRTIFLTSGRSRKYNLGDGSLELRHAPPWQLRAPETRAGAAFRALEWLGPKHVAEYVGMLSNKLNLREQKELFALRAGAPGWLAKTLTVFAPHA
ncbi:MAG: DUF6088 family protein [Rhodospirillales bacterium]